MLRVACTASLNDTLGQCWHELRYELLWGVHVVLLQVCLKVIGTSDVSVSLLFFQRVYNCMFFLTNLRCQFTWADHLLACILDLSHRFYAVVIVKSMLTPNFSSAQILFYSADHISGYMIIKSYPGRQAREDKSHQCKACLWALICWLC